MQHIGIIILLIVCLVVLFALFRISYKILIKVRKEERAINTSKKPERQLHPKLVEQMKKEQAEKDKKAEN